MCKFGGAIFNRFRQNQKILALLFCSLLCHFLVVCSPGGKECGDPVHRLCRGCGAAPAAEGDRDPVLALWGCSDGCDADDGRR